MSNDNLEYLHVRLREDLKSRGFSVASASRKAGEKSPSRLNEIMNGRQRLNAELLARLVLECNVDANYVLTGQRNAHEITTDHVRTAFQMVRDAEAQLPMGQYLDETQRVDAVCSLLKAAQSLGHIPDRSAAIAVLMSMV